MKNEALISQEKMNLQKLLKDFFEDLLEREIPIKSIEKYTNDLIDSYKELYKPEMNDELALEALNFIADSRKNNKKNLESIFLSVILKNYENFSRLISNENLFIPDDFSGQKAKIQKDFEKKFLMKNYKNFSKPDQNLQKINEEERNSKDATRIYELIAKTQKIETGKDVVSKMQKETDYLEKIMDAFRKYKGKADLTIKDLRDFIESSNDGVETTRALINFYDSKGEVGKNYLDNFAFDKGINTGVYKEDPSYLELWNKGLIETAQRAKNFSANVIIRAYDEKRSLAASSVLYKIDKENEIVYFLTNEHVVNHKNIKNVKIQTMNPDLSKPEYKAEIAGFSENYDIGLIAVKFSAQDIERMSEPKINENVSVGQDVILIGNVILIENSHGAVLNDFSTNVTIGKMNLINSNEFISNAPCFDGNSGRGIFNKDGDLIAIFYSGDKDFYDPKTLKIEEYAPSHQESVSYSFSISVAKKIADELIQKYEKQNNIQNGIFSKKIIFLLKKLICYTR